VAVNKGLKKFKNTLAVLSAKMALPAITASALRAMHHFAQNHHHRKLLLIDSFHGYGCNWCGCRFPETRVVEGRTASETVRLRKSQRQKQFADHICSEWYLDPGANATVDP
jgi:hypothetical protein